MFSARGVDACTRKIYANCTASIYGKSDIVITRARRKNRVPDRVSDGRGRDVFYFSRSGAVRRARFSTTGSFVMRGAPTHLIHSYRNKTITLMRHRRRPTDGLDFATFVSALGASVRPLLLLLGIIFEGFIQTYATDRCHSMYDII